MAHADDGLNLRLTGLAPDISGKVAPFFSDIVKAFGEEINSLYVVGSALTPDYHPKTSDINTVVLFNRMDLQTIRRLAPIGRAHAKKRISPPLLMTEKHIEDSIDVFPVEFLNFRLVHLAVYGEDIFGRLQIDRKDLRLQCERELKVMLVGLRQGYLSMLEDQRRMTEAFFRSIKSYIPLMRGLIHLLGKEPPVAAAEVIGTLSKMTGVNTYVFSKVHEKKRLGARLSQEELNTAFEQYFEATRRLAEITDEVSL
ncbi:MAG: hypothetical protein M0Z75_09165 [Nitrospiraceae bacterium]|nr:hypothetical protein [Nitrospiraceae bacterium]